MADVICCMLRRGEKLNVHSLRLYNISLKILYLIFDYPHKHYTFKYFEV